MTWADIAAWSKCTGVAPEPWEMRAIFRLGRVVIAHWNDQTAKPEAQPSAPKMKLTAENFVNAFWSRK